MTGDFVPQYYTFNAAEAASIGLEELARIQANQQRSIPLSVPGLSDYFANLMPGQMCQVIGQTSNFKSGFIRMWANQIADFLAKGQRKAAIVYVSLEDTIEEMVWQEITRVGDISMRKLVMGQVDDWNKVQVAAAKIGSTPLIRIGYRFKDQLEEPMLNMDNIRLCIDYALETYGIKDVAVIILDYMQALAARNQKVQAGVNDQRRLIVRYDTYAYRRMMGKYNCPGIFGSMAKAILDHPYSKNLLIPGVQDGSETAALGERTDRSINLWMPKTTPQIKSPIKINGFKYSITDNLLLVWVSKQRGNLPAGKVFVYDIDYRHHTLTTKAGAREDPGTPDFDPEE
jgi:hypothetical protein